MDFYGFFVLGKGGYLLYLRHDKNSYEIPFVFDPGY
jgi:hypothetical protein